MIEWFPPSIIMIRLSHLLVNEWLRDSIIGQLRIEWSYLPIYWQIDGWMDEWVHERMNEWTNE